MTEAERRVVMAIINGMKEEGYVLVPLDLIGRLSDYFHVNSKPENDLAQKYMAELDAIIMRP